MTLENKIFISTRPEGRNEELTGYIREQGGQVLEMPMIKIQPRPLDENMKKVFSKLSSFQWLVFTSPNGIRYFFHHLQQISGNEQLPEQLKIATIGKSTAAHLKKYNVQADFINSGSTSDDFARALETTFGHSHPKLLWPTGNLSRNVIANKLQGKAEVSVVYVYNTAAPEWVDQQVLDKVINDRYDLIIFTSPSGFDNFKRLTDDETVIQKLRIASIGKVTTEAIERYGIQPELTARMSNAKGIADSIGEYYRQAKNTTI